MNDPVHSRIKDECLISTTHETTDMNTQRVVVDFGDVSLAKIASLAKPYTKGFDTGTSWNYTATHLRHTLHMFVIGPVDCTQDLLGERHLTLEFVVKTNCVADAMTSIAKYLDDYDIDCGIIHI